MFLENTINSQNSSGWIEVITGSKFSGKTEELIRRLKIANIARQETIIFKPAIENSYDEPVVVSHDANYIDSISIPSSRNIPLMLGQEKAVGIDEAQLFDSELVKVCNDLANQGRRMIVAGLDMDFSGKPFGPLCRNCFYNEQVS